MHIFPLNPKTHADFLKQERKDPITGDAFKAGDEVVFCAACRSAFLRESWEFMEGKHCNQEETLESFPKAQKALTLQKLGNKRWYPSYFFDDLLRSKKKMIISVLCILLGFPVITYLVGVIYLFLIGGADLSFANFGTLYLMYKFWDVVLGLTLLSPLFLYFPFRISYKFFISRKLLRIYSEEIAFKPFKSLKVVNIEYLKVKLIKRVAKNNTLQFTIQLKNKEGLYIEREIHGNDDEINTILEALTVLSKHTKVTVSIQYQREYDFLLEKKAQYQAPIEIEILD